MTRERRGVRRVGTIEGDQLWFAYEGLDGVLRRTRIQCVAAPDALTANGATFVERLGPKEEKEIFLTYGCQINSSASADVSYPRPHAEVAVAPKSLQAPDCQIRTSSMQFNEWLIRSSADLHMMFTATPYGFYPYAGVPWFSTPFGRDGIITAL